MERKGGGGFEREGGGGEKVGWLNLRMGHFFSYLIHGGEVLIKKKRYSLYSRREGSPMSRGKGEGNRKGRGRKLLTGVRSVGKVCGTTPGKLSNRKKKKKSFVGGGSLPRKGP